MHILKKVLALICVFEIIAIGWYFLGNFRSEPPTPIVTVNDTKIPTTLGSYCWSKLLSSECVDKEYRHPIDMAKEHDQHL